jgi:hypothetical protein
LAYTLGQPVCGSFPTWPPPSPLCLRPVRGAPALLMVREGGYLGWSGMRWCGERVDEFEWCLGGELRLGMGEGAETGRAWAFWGGWPWLSCPG